MYDLQVDLNTVHVKVRATTIRTRLNRFDLHGTWGLLEQCATDRPVKHGVVGHSTIGHVGENQKTSGQKNVVMEMHPNSQ